MDDFKFDEFKKLEKEVLRLAKKYPKETKKFLQTQGNKLKQTAVKIAKSKVKKKTGNYQKGFKRGKVYKYNDTEDSVRIYNSMPHAHLIEYGHVLKDKNGKEHGFVKGLNVLEKASREYHDKFVAATEDFIDDVIKNGGF